MVQDQLTIDVEADNVTVHEEIRFLPSPFCGDYVTRQRGTGDEREYAEWRRTVAERLERGA